MRYLRCGALTLLAGLSACGGGGGATSPTSSPLEAISLVMPGGGSLETSSSFKLSDASAAGLQALWDFGDGTQSSSLNPEHSYVRPGSYTVSVRLSLPSGGSKTLSSSLQIDNWSFLKGANCAADIKGGWCVVGTPPAFNIPSVATDWTSTVQALDFLDADIGWAAADEWLYRTEDGGRHWAGAHVPHPVSQLLAIDKKTVWLRGTQGAGTLYLSLSQDGGQHFAEVPLPTGIDPSKVDRVRLQGNGVLVLLNSDGSSSASSDQGGHWQTGQYVIGSDSLRPGQVRTTSSDDYREKVFSFDRSTSGLWRLAGTSVQRSLDGGINYTSAGTLPSGCGKDKLRAYQLKLLTWADPGQSGSVCLSNDGGAQWTVLPAYGSLELNEAGIRADGGVFLSLRQYLQDGSDAVDMVLLASSSDLGSWLSMGSHRAYSPRPAGANTSYECLPIYIGGERRAVVRCVTSRGFSSYDVTDDAGATWSAVQNRRDLDPSLRKPGNGSLIVANDQLSWGNLRMSYLASADGGVTWSELFATAAATPPSDALFLDSKNAIGIQRLDGVPEGSFSLNLSMSRDGGRSWAPLNWGLNIDVLALDDSGALWRRAQPGAALERSLDGGQSFQTALAAGVSSGYSAIDIRRKDWWLMGGGGVTSTTDAGKTWLWTAQSAPISLVHTLDDAIGLALVQAQAAQHGQTCVLRTLDQGKHWSDCVDTGTNATISAITHQGSKVWAVGEHGALIYSENAGQSWRFVPLNVGDVSLYDVRFANAQRGWIVGDGGLVLTTRDGGQTWVQQPRMTRKTLRRINVVNEQSVWIAGDVLLGTATGGD